MCQFALLLFHQLTVAEVHASHHLFAFHPLGDFKRYYDNMKELTDKLKVRHEHYSDVMDRHFNVWKRAGPKTSRQEFHWNDHHASNLLQNDVKAGVVDTMSKEKLWKSRQEYGDFSRRTFTKHVYQEESKQRGGTYWQAKRNRKGRKTHDRDVSRLRREFHCNVDKDVNDLAEHWISMNRKESE